ncbi:MAG: DUF4349 domain-containing protein [Anaerolineae bacterium]|nr:MAG: DUF4349 domain-containing protein [Anaerolineae bacterium]
MYKKTLILVLVVTALSLAACAEAGDFGAEESILQRSVGEPELAPGLALEVAGDAVSFIDSDEAAQALDFTQVQDRLIIRTGNLSIIVEDTEETLVMIGRLAEARGGWIVSSNVFESGGAKRGDITIRIPAEEFDATLAAIKESAKEVPSEFTESQDVTEEYIDLDARLTNLASTADRVRNFLDDARNVEEALAVNRELSRLESDIEVIKGRMQYLSQSAAFSTLSIDITPDELSQPLEVGGWRPEGIARSAIEALLNTLQSLGSIFIWVVIFCLPLGIIFGIPAFLILRYGYRRWQRRRAVYEEDLEEE